MGGTVSSKHLKEYKDLTKDMVQTVVGLLKAQDLLFSASKTYENNRKVNIDKTGQGPTATENDLEECRATALELLLTAEVTTSERKESTMYSLDKFLRFLTETVKKETEFAPGDFGESSLKSYMQTKTKAKHNVPDGRLKSILSENGRLIKEVNYYKKQIKYCEEKLESYDLEKQNFTKLEDNLTEMKTKKDEQKELFEKHTREMIQQVNELNLGFEEEIGQLIEVYKTFKKQEEKLNDAIKQNETTNENGGHETLENSNDNLYISVKESEMETSLLVFENDLSSQLSIESESEMITLTGESRLLLQTENDNCDEREFRDTWKNQQTKDNEIIKDTPGIEHSLKSDENELSGFKTKTKFSENLKEAIEQKEEEKRKCHTKLKYLGENFRKALTKFENDVEMLLNKTKAVQHRNETLEIHCTKQAEKYKKKLQVQDDTISKLSKSQDAMISQEHKLIEELKDKNEKILHIEMEKHKLENKHAQIHNELEMKYTGEISRLKVELVQKEKNIDEVAQLNLALDTQNTHLEETVKQKQQEIEKKAEEVTKLNAKLDVQNANLDEVEKQKQKDNEKARITFENMNINVTKMLAKYEQEKEDKEKELLNTQAEMKNQEAELNVAIKDRDKEIESLKEAVQKLEIEKTMLNFKLDENEKNYQDEINKVKIELENNEKKSTEVTELNTKLDIQNTQLEETVKQKQKEIEKAQKTYEDLNKNITKMLTKYENEIKNKEKELYTLQDEKKNKEAELNAVLQDRDKEIVSMKEALQKLETENINLNSKGYENEKRYQDEISKMKIEVEKNEKKAEEVEKLNAKLDIQNTQMDETIKQKQQEIEKSQKTYEDLNNNITKMLTKYENDKENKEKELYTLQDEKKNQEAELNAAIEDRDKEIESMKEALQKLEIEKTKLNCKLDENEKRYQEEISKMKTELEINEKKAEEVTKLHAKLDIQNTQLDETVKQKQQEIEKAQKTYEDLNNNITKMLAKYERDKDDTVDQLHKTQDEMKIQKAELNAAIYERDKEIVSTKETLLGLELEKTKLYSKYKENEKDHIDEINKFKIEIEHKEKKIEELIKTNENADETILKLKAECDLFETQKQNLTVAYSLLEQEKHQLKNEKEAETKLKLQLEEETVENKQNMMKKDARIIELEKQLKNLEINAVELQNTFESKCKTQEDENQRLGRQFEMLRTDLNKKLKSANADIESLKNQVQEKTSNIQEITKQHGDTEKELSNKINSLIAEHSKYRSMQDRKVKMLEDMLQSTENSNRQKESHIVDKENCIALLQQEKSDLNDRLKKINDDLTKRTKEKETFRRELEKIKSRKIIQVQLYSQSGVGLLSSVEDELICVLKSKMDEEEHADVDVLNCAKASDIQPEIPLFILCIQASRLGTAVASTVQGLSLTPKMAVLIFHHKDVHALPNQASERVLTGQELRNLGGIFDLAFLSGKGIYPCEMNRTNFVSVVNFLKRQGTKKTRDDI